MGCNCLKPKNIKDKLKRIKQIINRDVKEMWIDSKQEIIISYKNTLEIKKNKIIK